MIRRGVRIDWSASDRLPSADGLLLDITGWRPEEIEDGVALMTELGRWPGGRALYDPLPGEPRPAVGPGVVCRFHYSGDTP
ncbi:hypothetical protein ACIG8K_32270 [Streptomyces halstedii]|uniref:hypothetical protein n=1 Tax=Streptomyces halstedii TaxID=1944 RepID=UPI0037D006F6